MKFILHILVLVFIGNLNIIAQNLITNYSFEDNTGCPINEGDLMKFCPPWIQRSSSDYFHPCFDPTGVPPTEWYGTPQNLYGNQEAATGVAYAGIKCYRAGGHREYIGIGFNQNLVAGFSYCLSFKISLADSAFWAIDELGAHFTSDTLKNINQATFEPDLVFKAENGGFFNDTENWMSLVTPYIANGTERFITIGNFKDDDRTNGDPHNISGSEGTAYYYIDDVELYLNVDLLKLDIDYNEDALISDGDTLIMCEGNTLQLTPDVDSHISESINYIWEDGSTEKNRSITQSGTYSLKTDDLCENFASDEIIVKVIDCKEGCLKFPTAFTPNNDGINDKFRGTGIDCDIENFDMKIYDRWGNLVFETNDNNFGWDGTTPFRFELPPMGVYMWVAKYRDLTVNFDIEKSGGITLIR